MKALNLTGMRFGRLLVVRRVENIGKKTAWLCLCDCGTGIIVRSMSLTSGETKSCGCLQKPLDLTGVRFGRLLVIRRAENIGKKTRWLCLCNCGTSVTVQTTSLTCGKTKSCGCLHRDISREIGSLLLTKHGGFKKNPRLYKIWKHIIERCNNPKLRCYKNYGGRRITICSDWMYFENFYQWAVDNGYSDNLTIDRINANGNYEPNNCRWATQKTQSRNRRSNKSITFNGMTRTYIEWDEYLGLPAGTIRTRKFRGWSDERAITTKPKAVNEQHTIHK